jgi:hypothetical protein
MLLKNCSEAEVAPAAEQIPGTGITVVEFDPRVIALRDQRVAGSQKLAAVQLITTRHRLQG